MVSDRSTWTVQVLADFLEEQHNADQEAIKLALSANNRRLDEMNEFRKALADATTRNITRQEHEAELAPLREKLDTIGKPNWVFIVGCLSAVIATLSGIWVLIGLQITVATTPQALAVEQLKTAQEGHASTDQEVVRRLRDLEVARGKIDSFSAESSSDRTRLNDRLAKLEQQVLVSTAERKANEARIQSQIVSLNAQDCSTETLNNVSQSHYLRMIALLWKLVTKDELPIGADTSFHPNSACARPLTQPQIQ